MFSLLSRASSDNVLEPANIKVDAPLAGYKQGLNQLAHIGNHIWSNSAAYGSDRFCPRYTVNVLKLRTLVSFCSQINVGYQDWISQNAGQKSKRKTLIRLLLQETTDLGLPCLFRLLWQATMI